MLQKLKKAVGFLLNVGSTITAEEFPVTKQVIEPARVLAKQPAPKNSKDFSLQIRSWFDEIVTLPENSLYIFSKVRVSWHGVVLHKLQLFIPSLAYPIYKEEFSGSFLLRQWLAKNAFVKGSIGLIYDHWAADNYYHWLVDTLPRALLLRKKYPGHSLLVPASTRHYVTFTTAALGFTVLQPVPTEEFVQAEVLIMPSHVAPPGKQHPELIRAVRSELLASIAGKYLPQNTRVYVSRNRQSLRRIANEEALLSVLEQYNISVVYFEELSFEQQMGLMQHVELLVGLHGANLTNLLFMPAGAKVVELFNQEVCNLCYFHLASNLELEYYGVPCTPIIGSSPVDVPNGDDVVVDIDFLKKALDSVAA